DYYCSSYTDSNTFSF
nr:immunoglobulin light chain junction region [Macaca mulatta]MOX79544.1 immunoglobulin light chain junction region [Macaca mulatta]MOX80070.1 immunoglobulin light chain junction region [Macaca mulatta]MOX80608.1 immunoglobulin light chain junction region [Macaca mulatta]MOX81009.1 immunoglobulin light chain junction region [Macaca mulatta]